MSAAEAHVAQHTTVNLDHVPTASSKVTRGHAWRILTADKKLLAVAVAGHAIASGAAATVPYFIGQLVEAAASGAARSEIFQIGAIASLLAFLSAVLIFFAQRLTVVLVQRSVAGLRVDVLQAIAHLPLAVVEATGTGDLVSRTTRDVDTLTRFSMQSLPSLVNITGSLTLTVLAVPLAGGWVSLGFLVVVPWIYLVFARHFKRSRSAYVRSVEAAAHADSHLNETVEAVAVVDALALSETRRREYLGRLRQSYDAESAVRRLRFVFFPTPTSAIYVGTIIALLWGAWLANHGWATLAQVSAVTLYAVSAAPMLTMAGFLLDEAQLAETALARLVGVFEVPSGQPRTPQEPRGSDLEAKNVNFSYRDQRVIRDLSVTIPQGQRVVIVGPSGSGKSTLARLFTGVVTPGNGEVTLGGVQLRDLDQDTAHRHIMMLTQEYHVFSGDLRRNLKLAAPQANDDALWAALETVHATSWARALPDGLSTLVAHGEHRLSPGQAQEVALARVLLANPPVVILDEATSLLDGESAQHIEEAIEGALAGRTVIAIAHRLGVAARSDRVLVIDHGQIVEDGPHSELCVAGGRYQTLWDSWSHGRSLDDA